MKTKHVLYILPLIFGSFQSIAQTKMIAFKSHSGNPALFDPRTEMDNFGELPTMQSQLVPKYDTVKVISDSQIVEIWHYRNVFNFQVPDSAAIKHFSDTVVTDPTLLKDTTYLKSMYPETTILRPKVHSKKVSPKRSRSKNNDLWLLYLLVGGTLISGFMFPFLTKKTNP